jgi:hypothetical protein
MGRDTHGFRPRRPRSPKKTKIPDYSEAALLSQGIPYALHGEVPANLRSRERRAFCAKWDSLRREGGRWLVGAREILPESAKQAAVLEAYRDPRVGYISALPLYLKLRERYANLTRRDVERIVGSIASHQIQRLTQRETVARPAVSRREGAVWQVDLKDFVHGGPAGKQYFLIMVDTHSKFACGRPLQRRLGSTLAAALCSMVESLPAEARAKVRQVQGDREFAAREIVEALGALDPPVRMVHSLPHKPTTNGQVERTIGTVSSRLFRYLKENPHTRDWRRVFGDTLDNYNRTWHSSIRMTPAEALHRASTQTRAAIVQRRQQALAQTMARERRKFRELRVGDPVRISLKRADPAVRALAKQGRLKGHSLRGNWTAEVYRVARVLARSRHSVFPTFKLEGRPEVFKREELQHAPGNHEAQ